jgi:hypothetical protein
MSEMQEVLARLAVLEKEGKERSGDPVSNRNEALIEHLNQRSAALPNHDLSDLVKRANALAESPENSDQTNAFVYAVSRFISKNGPVAHEFSYILDLAEEAHQYALDAKTDTTEPEPAKASGSEPGED